MRQSGIATVLIGLALVLAAMVAMRPLLPIDETRYLSVAWEMWLSNDPVHLTKNFDSYTHKPPLLFWLVNLVWLVTGVSELAGRLVGPATAVAMVAATGALARQFWPEAPHIAARSVAILSGFTVFLLFGSATMFDALLSLATLGGLAALWRIGAGQGGRNWLYFGLALAFGIYAKGPVIFVHLMPALLTLPLWAPHPPKLPAILRGFGLSLLVALALVALWLVPALITGTPEFRTELLWTQSAARVAGGMAHDRPIWFLIALLPVLLFPWGYSLGLWQSLRGVWSAGPATRLCVIWGGSTLILFSLISGKQAHYLLPAFPAVALLFAHGLQSAPRARSLAWLPLLLAAGGFGAIGLGLIPAKADLALLSPLWPALAFAILCLALAAATLRLPLIQGHILAGAGFALGLHGVIATTALYPAYDGRPLAETLAASAANGLAVIDYSYNAEFNFLGRMTDPVATPQTPADLADWAAAHPQGLIFGLKTNGLLTAEPQQTIHYKGEDWAIWPASVISRE
jgi:4-amino-4-deoxy-L-arabinose transferase-like glycosyltransferase